MESQSFLPPPELIERAVAAVRRGGIVLYPTDTVYGLGCDPFNEAALERLLHLKGRDRTKGFLVLIPEISFVQGLCLEESAAALELMKTLWPGPVTFLLRAASRVPAQLRGASGKLGVRCPEMPFLRQWLATLGGPLVSTSANRSGRPAPASFAGLKALFELDVDLVIEGGEVDPLAPPSSVVDLTLRPPVLVRAGRGQEKVIRCLEDLIRGESQPSGMIAP